MRQCRGPVEEAGACGAVEEAGERPRWPAGERAVAGAGGRGAGRGERAGGDDGGFLLWSSAPRSVAPILAPSSGPRRHRVSWWRQRGRLLGAKIYGAELCKLGAIAHGAE